MPIYNVVEANPAKLVYFSHKMLIVRMVMSLFQYNVSHSTPQSIYTFFNQFKVNTNNHVYTTMLNP